MSKENRWVWEWPRRGFWDRLLFWRRPARDADPGGWVPKRVREHAELLAADQQERGW